MSTTQLLLEIGTHACICLLRNILLKRHYVQWRVRFWQMHSLKEPMWVTEGMSATPESASVPPQTGLDAIRLVLSQASLNSSAASCNLSYAVLFSLWLLPLGIIIVEIHQCHCVCQKWAPLSVRSVPCGHSQRASTKLLRHPHARHPADMYVLSLRWISGGGIFETQGKCVFDFLESAKYLPKPFRFTLYWPHLRAKVESLTTLALSVFLSHWHSSQCVEASHRGFNCFSLMINGIEPFSLSYCYPCIFLRWLFNYSAHFWLFISCNKL